MFTGLIETTGVIRSRFAVSSGMTFQVECQFKSGPYQLGESIAIDGICVTVETFDSKGFTFTASDETLKRGIIGQIQVGSKVHLERALRVGDRMGGHIVQGHVDGVGMVMQVLPKGKAADLHVKVPDELTKYIVEKGSISIQGVSLTVANLQTGTIVIALIPATVEETLLGLLRAGDKVNLEVDILAKYVESMVSGKDGLNEEKLRNWGF